MYGLISPQIRLSGKQTERSCGQRTTRCVKSVIYFLYITGVSSTVYINGEGMFFVHKNISRISMKLRWKYLNENSVFYLKNLLESHLMFLTQKLRLELLSHDLVLADPPRLILATLPSF